MPFTNPDFTVTDELKLIDSPICLILIFNITKL